MSDDAARHCIDCRYSQQLRWERLCLRWMPPRGVTPGQEACEEYRAKGGEHVPAHNEFIVPPFEHLRGERG